MANPYFNAEYYLLTNQDVYNAGFTLANAEQHYLQYGASEGRKPAPWFDATYYVTQNPDLLALEANQLFAHFTTYGMGEGRAPSAEAQITDANLLAYAKGNADLATAFGVDPAATELTAAQKSGLTSHFYEYGYKEDRPASPFESDTTPGKTFTLTTGLDNIIGTAGDDLIVGTVNGTAGVIASTLNAGDQINGGGGFDTVKAIVSDAAAATTNINPFAGVGVSNVEKLSVQNVNPVAANNVLINVQPLVGVTTVESLNSTQLVGFTGLATGAKVIASGAAQTGAVNFAMRTASDAVDVTVNGGVNGVTVAATAGTATTATINSTGAANGTAAAPNVFTLTGAANTLTALNVNAETNLRATLTATDFAATGAALVVAGAASAVNLGTNGVFKSIDASGLTAGGVTVGLSNVTTSFKGGAGNDSVTGAAIAAGAVIDGGAGVDTVQTSLINAGNAAAFKNFDILNVTGQTAINLDANLLTNSTITGAQIAGAYTTGASLSNLSVDADGFDLSVSGSTAAAANALTLGFKAVTGTEDKVNVVFSEQGNAGANTFAGTVTLQGIEQVAITSGGTAKSAGFSNDIILTDNALQTVTITGSNATSLQVTAQTLIGTATTGALTTIDASAATGRFTFVESVDATSKGLTIKGSAGVDNITVLTHTLAGGTYGADTITLGAGADTVNVGGATLQVVTNAAAVTTITDAAAGDILDFSAALAAQANFVSTAVSTAGATDLVTALTAIAAGAGAAATAAWGTYGGDTYVVFDVTGAGLSADDQVVKLVGTHSLATSTVNAGGDLVLAM